MFFPTRIIATRFLLQADATLQLKDQTYQRCEPLWSFKLMGSSEILLYFPCHQCKVNWPPRVQMMENQTHSFLHKTSKNWFTSFHLTMSGSCASLEKYCALQTFSSIMTSEMYILSQCYWAGLWNNLWTTSIWQNTQRGHDLLRP